MKMIHLFPVGKEGNDQALKKSAGMIVNNIHSDKVTIFCLFTPENCLFDKDFVANTFGSEVLFLRKNELSRLYDRMKMIAMEGVLIIISDMYCLQNLLHVIQKTEELPFNNLRDLYIHWENRVEISFYPKNIKKVLL